MGTVPAGFPWMLLAALVAALPLLSVPAVCLTCVYAFPKPSEMHLPKMLVSDHHACRSLGVCSPLHTLLPLPLLRGVQPYRGAVVLLEQGECELYPRSGTRAKPT